MARQLKESLIKAIERYLAGNANAEERKLVNEWYNSFNDTEVEVNTNSRDLKRQTDVRLSRRLKEIMASDDKMDGQVPRHRRVLLYKRIAAAAAIVLIISTAALFYLKPRPEARIAEKIQLIVNDVAPGGNKAILTLHDGSRIALDDVKTGELALQHGVSVTKTAEGHLVYLVKDPLALSQDGLNRPVYNTIETPRGGQYQINLPDGSKVWLNAASALTFPAIFTTNERKVTLTGEAYFEIAHNKSIPFRVENNGQTVEVLGTHFNINSYPNQGTIKTTLLEGLVKITQTESGNSEILKPDQEANTSSKGTIVIGPADIKQAVSWKNGEFRFNDMTLTDIMKQLERWYDVEVDYSEIPHTRYNVLIPRNVNLSRVLRILEVTGKIKFDIEGKKIKIIK